MNQMRAAQYSHYGPAEVLAVRDVPVPPMRPGHVLVRVAASSINGADVAVRAGKLRLVTGRSFPRGAGFDFAGEIVETAADVTGFETGDQVWGFVDGTRNSGPSGAAAEFVLAPVPSIARRPLGVSAVEAAALAGAGAAAVGVLRDHVRLRPGERVLVRGANGGVGTAAMQVARALGGRVTALAGAPHLERLRDLGAENAYDHRATDPRDLGTFDVIVDPVSRNMRAYRRLLAREGRMAAMAIGSPTDLAYLAVSALHGRRRVRFVQSPPTAELLADLAGQVDAKSVVPVIEAIYPLDEIAAAHRAQEQGGGFGKRVLRIA
jgi:NADPH:quinone reductase-like Zn-dependent oxidoreductase